ncbi:MAG: tRNA preQ1(34) S-adenosylmethionine ribosyltransferase-isomerase QueA [Acidobacteriaceae bacterium]|nr:tRNA preQ1(34) S-adenosylmethionine ribosyltransferase-isomerase QueA [Acidobacteriaceae bacterium]MBV9763490.1 tRNA preQ1(34) S-adenosylmethionine ribosyltransferase-isomerase QueA [Acidobacteriaceae bacterium]
MQVSDFYYELPEELIAQEPLEERAASRMLVVSREKQSFHDDVFANFSKYVSPGDCLVVNDTRVFPARLHGHRNNSSGAIVEVFLVRAVDQEEIVWNVLVKPGKRVRAGDRIIFGDRLEAEVLSQGDFGERTLRFSASEPVSDLLEEIGQTPLPPYIRRAPRSADRHRYQTVFAEKRGSVAAPTAGLHFTQAMLDACQSAGAEIARITLHVGLGTFAPLRNENVAEIQLHEEYFEISDSNALKMRGAGRLFPVGTTSVRTIETALLHGGLKAMQGETNLFIYPGFHFRGTGAMLTNFHLPQSSLLMLVAAFAGWELTLQAYRHAVAQKYRFFSYGDCMLIE